MGSFNAGRGMVMGARAHETLFIPCVQKMGALSLQTSVLSQLAVKTAAGWKFNCTLGLRERRATCAKISGILTQQIDVPSFTFERVPKYETKFLKCIFLSSKLFKIQNSYRWKLGGREFGE
jgi:hypothetical protein